MKSLSLLIISPSFPPIAGSLVPRLVQITSYFSKTNWNVHVLTTQVPDDYPFIDWDLLKKIPENISIYRTESGYLRKLYLSSPNSKNLTAQPKRNKITARIITKYMRQIIKSVLIPDTYVEWFPFAISQGNSVTSVVNPDVIISVATPFSTHLVSTVLAKRTKCPLILDYADPWLFDASRPRRGLRYVIEYLQERWVLRNASYVTVVTENAKQLYRQKWPFIKDRVDVVHMGYDPADFENEEDPLPSEFVLTYTGRLPSENRNATPFFKAVSNLKKKGVLPKSLKIDFWGNLEPKWKSVLDQFMLRDVVTVRGWVSHSEFCSLLLRSNGLILFGNKNVTQVPGKIFHYLGSGRPILYIMNTHSDIDPTENFVRSRGGYIITDNKVQLIEESIMEAYSTWSKYKTEDYAVWKNKATEYSWESQLQRMEKITRVVAENR